MSGLPVSYKYEPVSLATRDSRPAFRPFTQLNNTCKKLSSSFCLYSSILPSLRQKHLSSHHTQHFHFHSFLCLFVMNSFALSLSFSLSVLTSVPSVLLSKSFSHKQYSLPFSSLSSIWFSSRSLRYLHRKYFKAS